MARIRLGTITASVCVITVSGWMIRRDFVEHRIVQEWRSRLEPMVDRGDDLEAFEKRAKEMQWNFETQAPVAGTEVNYTRMVFKEQRTLWSPLASQHFQVWVDFNKSLKAKSLHVESSTSSF